MSNLTKKLISDLKEGIKHTDPEDMDDKSWGFEYGVLISANQAKFILNILKEKQ